MSWTIFIPISQPSTEEAPTEPSPPAEEPKSDTPAAEPQEEAGGDTPAVEPEAEANNGVGPGGDEVAAESSTLKQEAPPAETNGPDVVEVAE